MEADGHLGMTALSLVTLASGELSSFSPCSACEPNFRPPPYSENHGATHVSDQTCAWPKLRQGFSVLKSTQ